MAGIYIHIPFCKQACHYCNFHFTTSLHYKSELVVALIKEIELRKEYLYNENISTIYFGGGTPSLLDRTELDNILGSIRKNFKIENDTEITFETNPDDITDEKLIEWKETGINRLSIGVQSFFEDDLIWMNRAHSASQAVGSLQSAVRYFNNISVDLIYGTPGLTNEKWKKNVDMVIAMGIPHLSCYALTVEPKTPLDKMIREKKAQNVNADLQSEQFLMLMQWMEEAGYEHYEISNFAKPGMRSRHNSSYWGGKKYLGIGPSAHSFDGTSRQWNVSNNQSYIRSIEKNELLFEKEILTPVQQYNEYIMTSLRTSEGIDLSVVENSFGTSIKNELLENVSKYIDRGIAVITNGHIILTREGKLLADGIASDLFRN